MKICFIFRKPLKGRHSIENVFDTIISRSKDFGLIPIKIYHKGNLIKTLKEIKNTQADIYHITGDVHYLSLFLPRNSTILTIHDMGAFKNNKKTLKNYLYYVLWFLLPIHYVKFVTAVSELTRNDLVKYTGVKESKIIVIPNPLSLPIRDCPKASSNGFRILQIGSGRHKNLKNLLIASKNIDCEIIIVGKPSKLELDLLDRNNLKYQILYDLSTEELVKIYKSIDLLFFASFSEGFGLPIIEAQMLGIPVITSSFSPMKEVSGGHAFLVDPCSIDQISKAIFEIRNNEETTKEIVFKGRSNATKYKPEKIAKKYFDLYKRIC